MPIRAGVVILLGTLSGRLVSTAVSASTGETALPFGYDLEGWEEYPTPGNPSDARLCAARSRRAWRVSVQERHLVVERHAASSKIPLPASLPDPWVETHGKNVTVVRALDDGWLIGTDNGEWGGGLWWLEPTNSEPKQIIVENVVGLVEAQGTLLALTGLAHGPHSRGSMYLLRRDSGGWVASRATDLGAAPEAYMVDQENS